MMVPVVQERRPKSRGGVIDFETMSTTSSAYVGKNALKKERNMSAQTRSIKLGSNSKIYYPESYYKRVGYQMSDAESRVDALGQRVRDRFNENFDTEEPKKQGGGLHARTLKTLKAQN